ncbi:MAG: hypothetical protein AAGD86_14915, partial [Pseudomonadota bacterium]
MSGWPRVGWLAIGVVAGYGLAQLQPRLIPRDDAIPAPAEPEITRAAPATQPRGLGSAAVLVSVERAATGEYLRTPALVVSDGDSGQRFVLMALEPVRDARSVFLELPGGGNAAVGEILAFDVNLGLVVLGTALDDGAALRASADSGTLYLGREFAALSPLQPLTGFVDSAARQTAGGHYVYALKFDNRAPAAPSALLDDRGVLIGLTLPPFFREDNAAARATAIDAGTVRELLDAAARNAPMSLSAFATFYANDTDAGRLERLARLVSARAWDDAIALAASLSASGTAGLARRELTETAYQGKRRAPCGHTRGRARYARSSAPRPRPPDRPCYALE